MTHMTDEQVKAAFLERANVTDHPYSRTPDPCCRAPVDRHLGYGRLPWSLPPVEEMRELIEQRES